MVLVLSLIFVTIIFSYIAVSIARRAPQRLTRKNELFLGFLTIVFWLVTVKVLHLHPDLALASRMGSRGAALIGTLTIAIPLAFIPIFAGKKPR